MVNKNCQQCDKKIDTKQEKSIIQPSEKKNKKLLAGIITGLLIVAVLVGIIWWLFKVKDKNQKK